MQVSTKLNRSHLVHGRRALILPCLGRTEKDLQAGGEQGVTVEDAMSMVHISYGMKDPASPQLRSECAIVAGMAQATLPDSEHAVAGLRRRLRPHPRHDGAGARGLRGLQRARPPPARLPAQPSPPAIGCSDTASGRAEFSRAPLPDDVDPGEGRLMLATVRSHDQFNTTHLLQRRPLPRPEGPADRGLHERGRHARPRSRRVRPHRRHQLLTRTGRKRTVYGYRAVRYDIPRGCAAGYMPELNVLCGIADFSTQSEQPVTKHLVVEATPSSSTRAGQ